MDQRDLTDAGRVTPSDLPAGIVHNVDVLSSGRRSRREVWDAWPVRIAVVAALVGGIIAAAILGDPEPEPWQAKTWELLHNAAAVSVGRPAVHEVVLHHGEPR